MTHIERLIIICLLASKDMDIPQVIEFVDMLEEACGEGEEDSIACKTDLITTAKVVPVSGTYGQVMERLIEIHRLESVVSQLQEHKDRLHDIAHQIEKASKGKLAERILIPRLLDAIEKAAADA